MDLNKIGSIEETIFTTHVSRIKAAYSHSDKKIIVSHVGELNQGNVDTIASFVENQLEQLGISKNALKRMYNIVIETLQNICIHVERENNCYQMTYFIIGRDKNEFHIYSGNIVSNLQSERLNKKLNFIKSLDENGIKKQYIEVLSNGEISTKGGAGLGFLTISLKSNNTMDFEFQSLNKEYSLFSLYSKVQG